VCNSPGAALALIRTMLVALELTWIPPAGTVPHFIEQIGPQSRRQLKSDRPEYI